MEDPHHPHASGQERHHLGTSTSEDFVSVSSEPISLDDLVRKVHDNGSGAISTFSGITRDTFHGKKVVRLEYEAYVPMAEKELLKICSEARVRWRLTKIGIVHRIGVVPIGETSVAIAVSSVHRKDSLEAVHYCIDTLKETVPIWKKEIYEDGEVWKQNAEDAKRCC